MGPATKGIAKGVNVFSDAPEELLRELRKVSSLMHHLLGRGMTIPSFETNLVLRRSSRWDCVLTGVVPTSLRGGSHLGDKYEPCAHFGARTAGGLQ